MSGIASPTPDVASIGRWLRRAERLLEAESDSAEFGYLLWFRSRGLAEKRPFEQLDLALELARRHGAEISRR